MTANRSQRRRATEPPLADGIVRDPTTSELREPYCVLLMDDAGTISGIVHTLGNGVTLTRTYWPGHADHRWPPTRVATTAQQARYMLAERPRHNVAVPASVVQELCRGTNLAFTSPEPQ
jgi:hypothetical protein